MKQLILALLVAATLPAQDIVWTKNPAFTGTSPGGNGYNWDVFDTISGRTIHYGNVFTSVSIYSDSWFYYKSDSTHNWVENTNISWGDTSQTCRASTGTKQSTRHPVAQQAIDTRRGLLWNGGGVCQGVTPQDMWYQILHADPTTNTMVQATAAHAGIAWDQSAFVYIPIFTANSTQYGDVIWNYGYDSGSGTSLPAIYCPTIPIGGGTATGTLSTAQINAGCTVPDDWNFICPSSNATGCGGNTTQPPYQITGFNSAGFDTVTQKIYLMGSGVIAGAFSLQLWSFNPVTKTFTNACTGGCTMPPGTNNGNPGSPDFMQPAFAYNTLNNKFYYHSLTPGQQSDWTFTPTTGTWTQLTTSGTGPLQSDTDNTTLAFDPTTNKLIAKAQGATNILWEGQLGGATGVTGQFRSLGTWPDGHLKWVEVGGQVPSLAAGGTATVTLTGPGGLTVPLEVREALYVGGTTGVARTNEPLRMGVMIGDQAGITGVSGLGLTGTVTTTSGNMATDSTPANPNSGTITVNTGAATFSIKKANFNVLDNVVVGSATVVGTHSTAASGLVILGPDQTQALPAKVTCGTCATVLSSANDSASQAVIEENGPYESVIKATGMYKDASGNAYMAYTVRLHFYLNQTYVRADIIRRNANYSTAATPSSDYNGGAGLTFNTAYKGFQADDVRIPLATAPTAFSINSSTTPQSGTLTGADKAYLYQGQTSWYDGYGVGGPDCAQGSVCAVLWTTDVGYTLKKNTTVLQSSTDPTAQIPAFVADCSASGVGAEIGVYQGAADYPKSLECWGSGDARIGIAPQWNAIPQYQPWPAWTITTVFLNFHTMAPASMVNDLLKAQHFLVARPTTTAYINSTGAFMDPIVDPTVEAAYYYNTAVAAVPAINVNTMCYGGASSAATCVPTPDRGIGPTYSTQNLNVGWFRHWAWAAGGQQNQQDWRMNDLYKYLQSGFTGRLINSLHWYKYFVAKFFYAHADGTSTTDQTVNGFTWRSRPCASGVVCNPSGELDSEGAPYIAGYGSGGGGGVTSGAGNNSLKYNDNKQFISSDVIQGLHSHVQGMIDLYHLTGDETLHEVMVPWADYYGNANTYQGGGFYTAGHWPANIPRKTGIELYTGSRLSEFYAETGTDSAARAAVEGLLLPKFDNWAKQDYCLSGFPAACTPPVNQGDANDIGGVSKIRGVPAGSWGAGLCPAAVPPNVRITEPFEDSILVNGLRHLAWHWGPSAGEYNIAKDYAFGIGQASTSEGFASDGTGRWQGATDNYYSGFKYERRIAAANTCNNKPAPGGTGSVSGTTVTRTSGMSFTSDMVGSYFYAGGFTPQQIASVNVGAQTLTLSGPFAVNYASVPYQVNPTGLAISSGNTITIQTGPTPDNTWVGSIIDFNNVSPYPHVTSVSGSVLTMDATIGTVTTPATFAIDGSRFGLGVSKGPDGVNHDIQMYPLVGSGTLWNHFLALNGTSGTIADWQSKFNVALVKEGQGSSLWPPDYGQLQTGAVIYAINQGSGNTLQDVPFSLTDNGGGNYHLGFTLPTGSTLARVKWSPPGQAIAPFSGLLGYNAETATFSLSPATNLPWFSSNTTSDTSICSPTCPTTAQSFLVSTGTAGMPLTNFSVKAMAPFGTCSISPTTLGPWTAGQSNPATLAATGCNASTWAVADPTNHPLPTGLSLNSSTGAVTGTITASGTFTPTIRYDTATDALNITVNAAPIVTTSCALPPGTQNQPYSSGGGILTAAPAGTVPDTWGIQTGSLPAGLSISGNSVIGTPAGTGTSNFTLKVTDANGISAIEPCSMTIGSSSPNYGRISGGFCAGCRLGP